MTEVWSLDIQGLTDMTSVSPVDERSIEQALRRLDGRETFSCGLTNLTTHSWLVCRGDSDHHLIEYVPRPLAHASCTGTVGSCIFFLARKISPDRHAVRLRWQSTPEVLVDVRADAVLSLHEATVIFTTFFKSQTIHQDFTTVPKPANGYLT